MTGKSQRRKDDVNQRSVWSEHDDPNSNPSTSRGSSSYSDRHGINKKVTFKAYNRGGYHFRKSWDSKTDLVRDKLDSEFSNRNGPSRNNTGRQSFRERNHSRGGHGNFRNFSWPLKESSTGWYSVFVPNVEDSDEVLKIIQTYITPVVFYPYNKQYFDNDLRFLVDDYKVAKALHNTSYKITQRDDRKLIIKVLSYFPPRSLISFTPVSSEIREKMIEAMATHYNPNTKSLNLSQFYACPLFTNNQLFVPLNRPAILLAALNMVAKYTKHDLYSLSLENNHIYLGEGLIWIRRLFPELKVLDLAGNKFSDLKQLQCLSGYTIEVLNLSRNPVCNTEDKERYIQDVQTFFPMLNKLDNSELPSRCSAIIRSKLKIPLLLGNCYPIPEGHNLELPNSVMAFVESSLTQFYEQYDNQVSRQMVSEAYHENATFTLSSCFLFNKNKGNLSQYLAESRNYLKFDRKKQGRHRFLHKGKENIINFLDKLPKTKHDLGSFIVDVPLATAAMVQIVLNGVFAEDFKETDQRHVYRSFCRTFCIVPVGSGWSIISDMCFITTVTDELLLESSKRFHVFKPKPGSLKKNNFNGNSNQNVTMFMEDADEIASMESSSSFQQPLTPTPSYPPSTYQQSTFSSYQPLPMTAPINPQQTPPYQETSTPQTQQTASSATVNFQTESHQRSNASFPTLNAISTLTTASLPVNQLSTELHANLISGANGNSDKLTMIKSFSNEFGMNDEWTKKKMSCDEEVSKSLPTTSESNNTEVPNEQNSAEGDANAGALEVVDDKASASDEYIHLRVITSDMTNEVHFRVKAATALVRLKRSYCSKLGFQVDELRFVFDGHRITDDDTPKKLGMINDDVIEIYQERTGGGMQCL